MAGPWEKYANPSTRYGADPYKVAEEERKQQAAELAQQAADRANNNSATANANSAKAAALAEKKLAVDMAEKGLMFGPDGSIIKNPNGPVVAPKGGAADTQKLANLRALERQIAEVRGLYNRDLKGGNVLDSIAETLPLAQNRAFDSAGKALAETGFGAFRVPGVGSQSDAEGARFVEAYAPSASDYDSVIEQKIANLENRLRDTYREMGIEPRQADEQPLPVAGNAPPAQGADRSAPLPVGPSFGSPQGDPSGFVPYGSTTRRIDNPEWKGVNDSVKGMIIAGQSPDAIRAYLGERGINTNVEGLNQAADYFRKTGKRDFGVNVDDIEVPMSGGEQFRNNAPQTRLGTAAAAFGNAVGMGVPQALAPEQMQYLRDQNPVSAFAGDVGGIIGATSAIGKVGANLASRAAPQLLSSGGKIGSAARAIAPDAVYGAGYGAVTEGDPLTGAATAAVGSAGGQLIGKGLQKGFQGVSDPAVRYLTERGIPLTIGQTLGNRGIAGRLANKAESVPVLGDMLARNRMDGLKAFEREALNDVVSPIGGRVTTGGTEGLEQAQGAVSQAYGDALSGVNVRPDAQFITDAQTAMQAGAAVPKFGEDFTYMMNQEVGPVFGQTGQLSGPQLQSALQSLGKIRSGFAKNPDAMAGYAADATGQMDDALSGLVSRQSPDTMPAYNAAKGAFQRLAPFENARISGVNQEAITPAQLARAITNNTKNFGGRAAAARGDNLTDLIRYGQEVLPPTIPNSGTAERIAGVAGILAPPVLGGASYGISDMSPSTAAGLAALAALSTKTGQKAAQLALTKRPKAVKRLGGIFGRRETQKGLAGMVTAPLLIED